MDTGRIYKAVTIATVVIVILCALYIMAARLGLADGLDFGAGAYYYTDIPDYEKVIRDDAYQTSVPYWVHVVLLCCSWPGVGSCTGCGSGSTAAAPAKTEKSMTGKAQMRCSRCGQLHEITLHSSINAMQEPALKASVKDGSLFVWECPHCGTANLARYACLYHDPQERLMIWLLPDGPVPETASVAATLDSLDGYTLRRVKDVGSLIEKVNLFDAGLEDTVMEMCKYVTRMELAEKDRSLADIPLKFLRLDGADNELLFSYPKDGQMHGARTGFHVYEDCRGILQR